MQQHTEADVVAVVQLLVVHGADVHQLVKTPVTAGREFVRTPLHLPVSYSYASVVLVLLSAGADPLAKCGHSDWQPPPLQYAVVCGRAVALRVLLAHPTVGIDALDTRVGTLLHLACWHGQPECLKVLLV